MRRLDKVPSLLQRKSQGGRLTTAQSMSCINPEKVVLSKRRKSSTVEFGKMVSRDDCWLRQSDRFENIILDYTREIREAKIEAFNLNRKRRA
jgi:hypothetical protein